MKIGYIIRNKDYKTMATGEFDEFDRGAVQRFTKRARDAWVNGHTVTTFAAIDVPEVPAEHDHTRQGDEYYCHRCNKRWGLDEEEPECTP